MTLKNQIIHLYWSSLTKLPNIEYWGCKFAGIFLDSLVIRYKISCLGAVVLTDSGIHINNWKMSESLCGEFCHNMRHRSKHRLVFCSFIVIWNSIVSYIKTILSFYTKYAKIYSNYLKMSGFSFRNVRYPRYQDTDLLQLWTRIDNIMLNIVIHNH